MLGQALTTPASNYLPFGRMAGMGVLCNAACGTTAQAFGTSEGSATQGGVVAAGKGTGLGLGTGLAVTTQIVMSITGFGCGSLTGA